MPPVTGGRSREAAETPTERPPPRGRPFFAEAARTAAAPASSLPAPAAGPSPADDRSPGDHPQPRPPPGPAAGTPRAARPFSRWRMRPGKACTMDVKPFFQSALRAALALSLALSILPPARSALDLSCLAGGACCGCAALEGRFPPAGAAPACCGTLPVAERPALSENPSVLSGEIARLWSEGETERVCRCQKPRREATISPIVHLSVPAGSFEALRSTRSERAPLESDFVLRPLPHHHPPGRGPPDMV